MGKKKTTVIDSGIEEKQEVKSAGASEDKEVKTGKRRVRVKGQKHKEAVAKIDRHKLYKLPQAVELAKSTSYTKFDGTIELHLKVKKQGLSVSVALPHSSGKKKKVEVADENTVAKLEKGKIDFDVLLATAEMMPKLVPFARLLGPRGMMPNPKNGTLIKDTDAAKKFDSDLVTLKTEKSAPVMHMAIGKVSMVEDKLVENIEAVLGAIGPRQTVSATISATMGPGIKIQVEG